MVDLPTISSLSFPGARVILAGSGAMAREYCTAFARFGIKDVTVIGREGPKAEKLAAGFGFKGMGGGFETALERVGGADLVVVVLPVAQIKNAAGKAVSLGHKNILIEKPGSLYSSVLRRWDASLKGSGVRLRVAYNRCLYPNLALLGKLAAQEGGIQSCRYTFTEWIHQINFNNEAPDVYRRWGIANSLHVISMAHLLIGMPKDYRCFRAGGLAWHPSGSRFSGAGMTEKGVLFSYHSDWESAGRWSIEVMTSANAYHLMPLEKLYRVPRGKVAAEEIPFEAPFADVKLGVAEEVAVMLNPSLEDRLKLPTLLDSARWNEFAEEVFGYPAGESPG